MNEEKSKEKTTGPEKPFICITCGKAFEKQRALVHHRTTHSKWLMAEFTRRLVLNARVEQCWAEEASREKRWWAGTITNLGKRKAWIRFDDDATNVTKLTRLELETDFKNEEFRFLP